MSTVDWEGIADRFAVRTVGAVFGRDEAVANFRRMWALLGSVEVVDRQGTDSGVVVQQVLCATVPNGGRVRVPMCMLFRLREGRVAGIDEFAPAAVGSLLDELAA